MPVRSNSRTTMTHGKTKARTLRRRRSTEKRSVDDAERERALNASSGADSQFSTSSRKADLTPVRQTLRKQGAGSLSALWAWILSALMAVVLRLLRLGPIPQHVAFVMDGNRRFAKRFGMEVSRGHAEGADTLEQTLDWCLRLGVKTVTVYAFSTENFSRDKEREVDPIMELCMRKFQKFASNSDLVQKHQIAVRIHGALHLLPPAVQSAAAQVTRMTSHHRGATLNVCMPYTAREEMTDAVACAVRGVQEGRICVDDISEELLEALLWTGGEGVDIWVRTSGEVRFSDFLLWQVSRSAQINFLKIMWPDFTFWHMLPALLEYQASHIQMQRSRLAHEKDAGYILKRGNDMDEETRERVLRVEAFLEDVRQRRFEEAIAAPLLLNEEL
ncbi:putative undecaprenyl diphosphate synthase-domain-containing protein [Chytriomyces sp. MP71]|nr:putative undecaprenyl diphosphate synthase-domain-containing protein [Chytriomyces sp. MP71]